MRGMSRILWIILSLALGIAFGIGLNSTMRRNPKSLPAKETLIKPEPPLLLTVPDLRQDTDYSCGASALQAVFAYWGIDMTESTLRKELRSNPEDGTKPEDIIRVARKHGLRAEMREGIGISDLRKAWEARIPVIVDIQAWQDNPQTSPPWDSDWEDGHYVVLLGVDDRNIYVEDPSLLGSRGVIPQQEFLSRWHDYEGKPPYDSKDRAYIHMGLFIEGNNNSRAAQFSPVQ